MTNFLYVEDDAMSRSIIEMTLKLKLGYKNLVIFENSADFMARVNALSAKPDVFFLDIHVTPHDGFEMLRMLRSHPDYKNATIVALTASVMNDEIAELKKAGFNGMVSKPINQDHFPAILERILQNNPVWTIY